MVVGVIIIKPGKIQKRPNLIWGRFQCIIHELVIFIAIDAKGTGVLPPFFPLFLCYILFFFLEGLQEKYMSLDYKGKEKKNIFNIVHVHTYYSPMMVNE